MVFSTNYSDSSPCLSSLASDQDVRANDRGEEKKENKWNSGTSFVVLVKGVKKLFLFVNFERNCF